MAFCINCGTELNEGAKFCAGCGNIINEELHMVTPVVTPNLEEVAKKEKKPKKKNRFGRFVISMVVSVIIGYVGWHIFVGWVNSNLAKAANNSSNTAASTSNTNTTANNKHVRKYTLGNTEINPDLKAFLDSYEEFMDEYVVFMKKYNSDPNNMLGMMDEYMQIMSKYTEFATKADAFDDSQMNDAEFKYYTEVMMRVEKKLLEAM